MNERSIPPRSSAAIWGCAWACVAWVILVGGGLIVGLTVSGESKPFFIPLLLSAGPGATGLLMSLTGIDETKRSRDLPGGAVQRGGRGWAIAGLVLSILPPIVFLVLAGGSGNT